MVPVPLAYPYPLTSYSQMSFPDPKPSEKPSDKPSFTYNQLVAESVAAAPQAPRFAPPMHLVSRSLARSLRRNSCPSGPENIRNAYLRRLARRGGVKRATASAFDETRISLVWFLKKSIQASIFHAEGRRKPRNIHDGGLVTLRDVLSGLKSTGATLYT